MPQTYEVILDRMLARAREADAGLDIREGSLIYSALAPAAAELQLMYIELELMLRESFADTQSREYLVRRAAERGVIAKQAASAKRLGEFETDTAIGSRFELNGLVYGVTGRLGAGRFVLECETPGSRGNHDTGDLTPCSYTPGFISARLTDVIEYGVEPETEEQLRRRYFQSLEALAFGGNAADYIQKAGALPGVGGVKVTPAWRGGGTVLLTVAGTDMRSPHAGIAERIQAEIDPKPGEGAGIAPIGHIVTVAGAREAVIGVSSAFTFSRGFDFQTVKPHLERAAEEYFAALRQSWPDEETVIVRISGLEQRFLGVPGIIDLTGTALNGRVGNLSLARDQLPVLGSVSNAG
jgi:uncharacterized phage protein gp47/JayE